MSTAKKSYIGTPSSTPVNPGRNVQIVTKVPGADKPIVAKFLYVPSEYYGDGNSSYWPANYFTHLIGPNPQTDSRKHVCQKLLGSKNSPEYDAYAKYSNAYYGLERAGEGNTAEALRLKSLMKSLKPSKGGYLFFVEPNDPTIKALKMSADLVNKLIGRKGNEKIKTIVGVIDRMHKDGLRPYDVTSNSGWVKIFKTGEKLSTEYHMEPYTVVVEEETKTGKKIKTHVDGEASVHPKVYDPSTDSSEIQLSDFPNPAEFERKFSFTYDEAVSFVESAATAVPSRFLKNTSDVSNEVEESEAHSNGVGSTDLDEIPF
jgi:hypothetical protein